MSKRTLMTLALAALVILGTTFAATSWARPAAADAPLALLGTGTLLDGLDGPGAEGPGGRLAKPVIERVVEHVAARLELTDGQREEIRGLVADRGPEIVTAVRAIKARRIDLFETIHAHPPLEADIREATADLAEAETNLALLRAQLADDVHRVLTPEQQDELYEMKQNLVTLVGIASDALTDRLAARLSA